ncbi:thrombopoietin isoform X5 [Nycticebus coucang]|uniref:thrombopoietin isoform X5 n=1 Tax=Nycticebus coucang TaxID=9470 RepID=UPI00234C1790|nr:thrombopoietin isoform X5 [Nycticebus coucang]
MENPDGADQGTGHSGSSDPSARGSDGSTETTGTHLLLIPPGAAFWTSPPPPWSPRGPPWNPEQDHSSQGSQCHLPELPTTSPRKSAFSAACRKTHSLYQADPTHHSCPKQYLFIPHTEQPPKQDFGSAGDKLHCLSQNYKFWTSEQEARTQSQDSWSAEPNFQIPGPNPWIPEQDTQTLEWNSWTLPWTLTQNPRRPRHFPRNIGHRLPATQPPAWIFSFLDPSTNWTVHTLLSFTCLTYSSSSAPRRAS